MKKKLRISLSLLGAFGVWTLLLRTADVQAIGPQNTSVGLATLNQAFHALTGVHWSLYRLTDWLSLIPLGIVAAFALLGLCQWMRRKKLQKVDPDLFLLGGFYLTVIAIYLLFEKAVVNYRPVLVQGVLEASYPSSTTVLVLCVMLTALLQAKRRLKSRRIHLIIRTLILCFTLFMVVGRLLSGVHWLTDILGGVLLSGSLIGLYTAAEEKFTP